MSSTGVNSVAAASRRSTEPDQSASVDLGDGPMPVTIEGDASGRVVFAHVPALDGLRGAAVAAVLLYHASLLSRTWLAGGFLGVDLFFVLSGFLITSLLLVEFANDGHIDLRAFWVRRFRRLVPALLVVLVGVAIYAVIFARRVDLGQIRVDGLATLFYAANWGAIGRGASYWDISLVPSPLQHTWSLAIEEQFYLVWPIVVWLVARRIAARDRWRGITLARGIRHWALVGAVASAGLFVGLRALGASQTRVYEGTDTRAVALLLGVVVAAARFERSQRPAAEPEIEARRLRRLEAAGVLAAALLGWAWVSLQGTARLVYLGLLPACSVAVAIVIAAAAEPSSPVLGRAFSWAPLRWLGRISYGLYLWHWPIFLLLTPARAGTDGVILLALRIMVSLAVATVSYEFIEQPIRQRAWRIDQPARSSALAVAGVAAVLLLGTVGAIDPVGNITDQAPRRALGDIRGASRVVFVGDSVAVSLSLPVIADPGRFGVNPFNEARIGCSMPAEGLQVRGREGDTIPEKPCLTDTVRAVRSIHPDVIVVSFGARPNAPVDIDGSFQGACTAPYQRLLLQKSDRFLRQLGRDGAVIELVTVARSDGSFAPASEPQNVACYNAALRAVADASPNIDLIDLDRYVCPNGRCRESVAAGELRPDGLHFSGPGGSTVSEWVLGQALDGLRH